MNTYAIWQPYILPSIRHYLVCQSPAAFERLIIIMSCNVVELSVAH